MGGWPAAFVWPGPTHVSPESWNTKDQVHANLLGSSSPPPPHAVIYHSTVKCQPETSSRRGMLRLYNGRRLEADPQGAHWLKERSDNLLSGLRVCIPPILPLILHHWGSRGQGAVSVVVLFKTWQMLSSGVSLPTYEGRHRTSSIRLVQSAPFASPRSCVLCS